jgi:futalosine hydrolase
LTEDRLRRRVLVVAATAPELCGEEGIVCGVGPVEAAAATARALAHDAAAVVLHIGVAGGIGHTVGALVVGTEAVYTDLVAPSRGGPRSAADPNLVAAVATALPGATKASIVTSAAVGAAPLARPRPPVEAMEGFGVLRAAQLAGVPAIEVRAISNEIGEEDRARWHVDEALAALADALPRLLVALRGS